VSDDESRLRESQLGDFIEDAKSTTISSYLQGMKENFVNDRYDIGQKVESELDFFSWTGHESDLSEVYLSSYRK
jgi:hypothetical protein